MRKELNKYLLIKKIFIYVNLDTKLKFKKM